MTEPDPLPARPATRASPVATPNATHPSPLGAFSALWFCYFAAMGTFAPYAPLWFKDLGFSTLAIGTILSLQSWTRVIAPYGWGWLGDHGGDRVRVLRLAAASAMLAACALLWARGYTTVALAAVLLFLCNGGIVPMAEAALSRHVMTAGRVDAGRYGRVRVWGSAGFVVAVLAVGWGLDRVGIANFPFAVVVTWAAVLAAGLRLAPAAEPPHEHGSAPPVLALLRRPAVAWFFAAMFFTVLAHTAQYSFFSLYLDSQGHGKAMVGVLYALGAVAEIAFFWWQGRWFPLLSAHRWLQWAAALALLRFGVTALSGGSLVWLVPAQLLHAITFAAQHAACIVLITRYFPGALRGRGQALYSVLGYGASGVVGGVAGGWLSTQFGFAAVFQAATVSAALGWWCATRARSAERRASAAA